MEDVSVFLQTHCKSVDVADTITVKSYIMDLIGYDHYILIVIR